MPENPPPAPKENVELQLKYAWDWFNYHASQRLTAFRFFLVILAAISAGYATALEKELYFMAGVVGLVGVFISFAFYRLDKRNEELVNDGRDVLDELEAKLGIVLRRRDKPSFQRKAEDLIPADNHAWERQRVGAKHAFWLRAILFVAMGIFFLAGLYGFRILKSTTLISLCKQIFNACA